VMVIYQADAKEEERQKVRRISPAHPPLVYALSSINTLSYYISIIIIQIKLVFRSINLEPEAILKQCVLRCFHKTLSR
jgi:hypothetical protein